MNGKQPLLVDTEGGPAFDGGALKRLEAVKHGFMRTVPLKSAFAPIKRLLKKVIAEEKGEEIDSDVWELDPKNGALVPGLSLGSLGHLAGSAEGETRDRENEGARGPEQERERAA